LGNYEPISGPVPPAIWDLNKPVIACSTRFEGHNYLAAVHIRIIFVAIVVRTGMNNTNNHSNERVRYYYYYLEKVMMP
jgi:hypothetical protein